MVDEKLRLGFLAHSTTSIYQRRIARARQVISEVLAVAKKPYIAFSTGKDSLVMAHLVWEQAPEIPAVYFDADAAFPESKEMLERYTQKHTVIIWKTEPILDTMERVGGPTSAKCEAATMKSTVYDPLEKLVATHGFDAAFVGLREEESLGRSAAIHTHKRLWFHAKGTGIITAWPVGKLRFDDIWAYIVSNNVDYCAVYDKQFEMGVPWRECRLSYAFGETNHTFGRWARLARGWPEMFNKFSERFPEIRRYI